MGYTHGELSYLKIIEQKKEFMHKNNLVIIRCHDVMDREPTFGMSKALAHQLELDVTNIVASDDMYHVYAIEPDSAINITKRFAKNLKIYNLPGIQFYGDKARVVRTVGIGLAVFVIQYSIWNIRLIIILRLTIQSKHGCRHNTQKIVDYRWQLLDIVLQRKRVCDVLQAI